MEHLKFVRACHISLSLAGLMPALALAQDAPPAQELPGAQNEEDVQNEQSVQDAPPAAASTPDAGVDAESAGAESNTQSPATNSTPTGRQQPSSEAEEIVVTGTATQVRKFDTSYAVSTFSEEKLEVSAPLNTVDLLSQVPGMWAESSGGEGANNLFARGIPQDGGFRYVALYEDGLPVFEEAETGFLNADILTRLDSTIARVEAVRGGSSGIFASNAPGGTINLITKKGTPTLQGIARMTWGDFDLYRLDSHVSGPINDDFLFSIGGFYRTDNGIRDPGFQGNRGGQLRGSLTYLFDEGEITAYGKYLNDRTIFHLPIPLADPRDPEKSLEDRIDPNYGTLASADLRRARLRRLNGSPSGTTVTRDLADGIHPEFLTMGLMFDYELDPNWMIKNHTRFVTGDNTFNAVFSLNSPEQGNDLLSGDFLADAINGFGSNVSSLAFRFAESGLPYDPAEADGLVIRSGWWSQMLSVQNFINDLRLTGEIDTGALGRHTVTGGAYFSSYSLETDWQFNTVLTELRNRPRRLDIVALDASGNQLGRVTEDGFISYGDDVRNANVDAFSWALYLYDEWQLLDDLRFDLGVRHQRTEFTSSVAQQTRANLGDPTTLADDDVGGLSGNFLRRKRDYTGTAFSAGLNYTILEGLGTFGRFTRAFRIPDLEAMYDIDLGQPDLYPETENILQAELGLKVEMAGVSLFAVGFWSYFDSVEFDDEVLLPETGRIGKIFFVAETQTFGLEAELALKPGDFWAPLRGLNIGLVTTLQDPRYKNVEDRNTGEEFAEYVDNQVRRIPQVLVGVRPSYAFDVFNRLNIMVYGALQHVGERTIDYANNTRLPDYQTLDLGLLTTVDNRYSLQLHASNLTNSEGLTEGNPRSGALQGQGTRNAIFGRPVLGRTFRVAFTMYW